MKKIYLDFDDYWKNGDHPWTSASIDIAREEWNRFEPTINASRDDYKKMYVELANEMVNQRCEHIDKLYKYIELFSKEGAPSFHRWWSQQLIDDKE